MGGGAAARALLHADGPCRPRRRLSTAIPSVSLAQLFTHELQRRHGPGGGGGSGGGGSSSNGGGGAAPRRPRLVAASVSPGFVGTAIFDRLPWPLPLLARPAAALARSPAEGAAVAVWAATAPEVGGGPEHLFLHDCAPMKASVGGGGVDGGWGGVRGWAAGRSTCSSTTAPR
jgi:hypothetical protein